MFNDNYPLHLAELLKYIGMLSAAHVGVLINPTNDLLSKMQSHTISYNYVAIITNCIMA